MNRILKIAAAAAAVLCGGLAQASIFINTNANCYDPIYPDRLYSRTSVNEFPPTFKWSFQTNLIVYLTDGSGMHDTSAAFTQVLSEARVRHVMRATLAVGTNYGFDGFAYYGLATQATTCSGDHIVYPTSAAAASQALTSSVEASATAATAGTIAPIVGIQISSAANIPPALAELSRKSKLSGSPMLVARATQVPPLSTMAELASGRGADALQVGPAGVETSPLHGTRMLGAMRSGVQTAAGWTGLTRIFEAAGGATIVLDELDLAAAGGGAIVLRELINADVNGAPARFETAKTPDGEAALLTWFAGNKRMSLTAPASADARVKLLAIARALY